MPGTRPKISSYLRFFDVDAAAELRRMPMADVAFCPRLGEHIDLLSDRESGGGVYVVVGVTHRLEDREGSNNHNLAKFREILIEIKPRHSDVLAIEEAEVALEIVDEQTSTLQ